MLLKLRGKIDWGLTNGDWKKEFPAYLVTGRMSGRAARYWMARRPTYNNDRSVTPHQPLLPDAPVNPPGCGRGRCHARAPRSTAPDAAQPQLQAQAIVHGSAPA